MIAELSAAMAAIKETASLVKVISDAKTDAEVKAATIDLQNKLLTLQAECFSLGDVIRLRDEEMVLLKAKIAEFDNFTAESEGYELNELPSGTFVYSKTLKNNMSEIRVNACPECFQKKKISLLQPCEYGKGFFQIFCPSCSTRFQKKDRPGTFY